VLIRFAAAALLALAALPAPAQHYRKVSGSTPQALRAELLDEIAKWSRVIAEAGIKPD
jgi:hypothetical protein